MMTSDSETIDELFEKARGEPELEAHFIQQLLDAVLYAHAPLKGKADRLQLTMFKHPAGLSVIPVFTSKAKAVPPLGVKVRIVAMKGRELFEITRGATLMLNPNHSGYLLYPEETASLLDQGVVARIYQIENDVSGLIYTSVADLPSWLAETLRNVLSSNPSVGEAYIRSVSWPSDESLQRLILFVGCQKQEAERVARATITAIQPEMRMRLFERIVDVMPYDLRDGLPEEITGDESPFYRRAPGLKH